jgi:uncharacterized protein YecT (DUF1311 family)
VLDDKQRIKLRDMQRSWVETRKRTCALRLFPGLDGESHDGKL